MTCLLSSVALRADGIVLHSAEGTATTAGATGWETDAGEEDESFEPEA